MSEEAEPSDHSQLCVLNREDDDIPSNQEVEQILQPDVIVLNQQEDGPFDAMLLVKKFEDKVEPENLILISDDDIEQENPLWHKVGFENEDGDIGAYKTPIWKEVAILYKNWKKKTTVLDFDLTNVNEKIDKTQETPPAMNVELHQWQKEGLYWATRQEVQSPYKGGIFSEKGAKLQIVALAIAVKETYTEDSNQATLLICKKRSMMDWERNLSMWTKDQNILVYHGKNKTKDIPDFRDYKIVLTSYEVLKDEYNTERCVYCKRMYAKEKLALHQIKCHKKGMRQKCIYCRNMYPEENLEAHQVECKENKQNKKVLMAKRKERESIPQEDRGKELDSCPRKAYGKEFSEGKQKKVQSKPQEAGGKEPGFEPESNPIDQDRGVSKGKQKGIEANPQEERGTEMEPNPRDDHDKDDYGNSILHGEKWVRIILDEGGCLSESVRYAGVCEPIFSLESIYKWALTETPPAQLFGEMHCLARFLRIPFSMYWCKICDCSAFEKRVVCGCEHENRKHRSLWNKYISKGSNEAKAFLKHRILKDFMIRRSKMDELDA